MVERILNQLVHADIGVLDIEQVQPRHCWCACGDVVLWEMICDASEQEMAVLVSWLLKWREFPFPAGQIYSDALPSHQIPDDNTSLNDLICDIKIAAQLLSAAAVICHLILSMIGENFNTYHCEFARGASIKMRSN